MKKYNSYKDSGVEWIGEIPSDWGVDKLNRIFQINTGFTPSTGNNEFYENGGHDWITIRDLEGKYVSESKTKLTDLAVNGKTIIPKGSLLYSFKLSVGQMAFTSKEIYTNEAIFSIFPSEKLNLNYYYYLLDRVLIHNSNENIYGAKILNQELIKASKLLLPSEEEQTSIANFLDHKTSQIDHLIAKKEQFIKLLEEERVAVINQAVTKGLDPNVLMKDSGVEWLGEIPEHWEVKKLKFFCFITKLSGFEYTKIWQTCEDGDIIALRGYNISNGKVNHNKTERISTKLSLELFRSKLYKNDIVYPCTGTIGNVALIEENDKYHINQNIARISPNIDLVYPKFLFYNMVSDATKKQIDFNNTSNMQPVILIGDLRNIIIAFPPYEEQIKLVKIIEEVTNRIEVLLKKIKIEIELLKEYKTALISEVVTGKVDVRDEKLNRDGSRRNN